MKKPTLCVFALLANGCTPLPFTPSEGTWTANFFRVTENTCTFETNDLTGETMNLTNTDTGFTFTFEGEDTYTCTLSNNSFECQEPDSLQGENDPDIGFSMEIFSFGSLISETELEITTRVRLSCIVDDCSEYEEYFETAFPCVTETLIGMSFSE